VGFYWTNSEGEGAGSSELLKLRPHYQEITGRIRFVGDTVLLGGGSASADHKYEGQSLFLRSFYYQNGDKTGTVTSSVAMISGYCRSILKSDKCVAYQILHLQMQNRKPECLKWSKGWQKLDLAYKISSYSLYLFVRFLLCVASWISWVAEGGDSGQQWHNNTTCYSFTTVQVLWICMLQHLLFRRLSEM